MPASQTTTTTEYFNELHNAGRNVQVRVLRLSDGYVMNVADGVFMTVATCPDPNFPATELTALGNATYSQYRVAMNMANFNAGNTPVQFLVQFREDVAAPGVEDTIISTTNIWVANSRRIDRPLMKL